LFCYSERDRGGANLADARELDERGNLIGAEVWQAGHAVTIQGMRL
jgi:hypothetical protein